MLLAHLSDSHLGYRQYGLVERERDIYSCFEEAIDRAIEEHVDIVVHSGDLFHSPSPPPQAYRSAIRSLKKLKRRGIPFVYVMGQHDKPKTQALAPLTVLEDMELLHHAGDKPYVAGDYSVVGLDYSRRQLLVERLQSIKPVTKKSILALHVLLKEVSPLGDISASELPKGFIYYALGDYHLFKEIKVHGSLAVYPGSSEVISLNDLSSLGKGFCIVDLSGDEAIVHFQRLDGVRPRIVVKADLESVDDVAKRVVSQASAMKLKPIVHLTVRGVNIKCRDVERVKEEISKVSLRVFVTLEDVEAISLQPVRATASSVEETIKAAIPGMSDVVSELYKAYRSGGLHSELERLFNSDVWINWADTVKAGAVKAEAVQQKPPRGVEDQAKPSQVKARSSTLLGWIKRDDREA